MTIEISASRHTVTLDLGRGKRRLEKIKGQRFLKGVFKKTRISGASATTPGNNQLHREFKVKDTKEHLLRSKAVT